MLARSDGALSYMWRLVIASSVALLLGSFALPTFVPAARSAELTATDRVGHFRPLAQIGPQPYTPNFAVISSGSMLGTTLLFIGRDDRHGQELWRSDGTAAGTTLVSDINPGPGYGLADYLGFEPRVLGNVAYFLADDGAHGLELWRSDGTAAGTAMVKDISPGLANGVSYVARVGGVLLLSTMSGLWRSDGTAAGTTPIAGGLWIDAGAVSSGGVLYFDHPNAVNGNVELWRSDGTAAGTRLVSSFPAGAYPDDRISEMVAVGSTLYFRAGSDRGPALWRSDGTPAGTSVVSYVPAEMLIPLTTTLLFRTSGTSNKLWRSDGTSAGTSVLMEGVDELRQPRGGLGPSAVFLRGSGAGAQLWRSDGTPAGTRLVTVLPATLQLRDGWFWRGADGRFLFVLRDGQGGQDPLADQVWVTDQTEEGTLPVAAGYREILIADGGGWYLNGSSGLYWTGGTPGSTREIKPGSYAPPVESESAGFVGGRQLLTEGPRLWSSDGATGGGAVIKTFAGNSWVRPALKGGALVGGAALLVVEQDGLSSLWRSDGTAAGTRLLAQLPDIALSYGIQRGGVLYLTVGRQYDNETLWRSDGTPAGTTSLGAFGTLDERLATATTLFSLRHLPGRDTLWVSDGTPAGTRTLGTFPRCLEGYRGPPECPPDNLAIAILGLLHGRLYYFAGREFDTEVTLWSTDGSLAGTTALGKVALGISQILPYDPAATSANAFALPERILFTVGDELWQTDGTAAGVTKLASTRAYLAHSYSSAFSLGDVALFWTIEPNGPLGLWRSDGTSAGTYRLIAGDPGTEDGLLRPPVVLEGTAFFPASDASGHFELWASDGTIAGTRILNDLPDNGVRPVELTEVAGTLVFEGLSPGRGRELWASDGTPEGTRPVSDLVPGPEGASLSSIFEAGERLYFIANTGDGPTLWTGEVQYPVVLGLRKQIQAEDYDFGGEGDAYHDEEPPDRGGAGRRGEGVDIAPVAGGGAQLAFTRAGEWLNYSVEVVATRVYTLELRVSSAGAGGVMHLAVDGVDVTGPIVIPDTGRWDRYVVITRPGLELTPGPHVLTLVMDSANPATGYVANVDWLLFGGVPADQAFMPLVFR